MEVKIEEFQQKLLKIMKRLLKYQKRPHPFKYIELDRIYFSLCNSEYSKEQFSADLSALWEAQAQGQVNRPYIEFAKTYNSKLAYEVKIPFGKVTRYGFVRMS